MSFDSTPRTPRTPEFMTPSRRSSWRQAIFQRVVTPMAESKPVPSMSKSQAKVKAEFRAIDPEDTKDHGHVVFNCFAELAFSNTLWP